MLRDVEFVGQERSDTTELKNTFPTIHNRNLVLAHQLFPGLLVIQSKALLIAPCFRSVVKVDGFFSKCLRKLF